LILDEPTTGLDVTTQAHILELVADLKRRVGAAILYISHDLAVIAQVADRVGVLYAGELVEVAPAADLFAQPVHPYTRGLLDALPEGGADRAGDGRVRRAAARLRAREQALRGRRGGRALAWPRRPAGARGRRRVVRRAGGRGRGARRRERVRQDDTRATRRAIA